MKLIKKFENLADADHASMLLSSHGIVTHVSSRGTKSLGYLINKIADAGLWCLLDEQYEDAVKLLNDNEYEVTTGLSEGEASEFKTLAESRVFASLNKAIACGVVLIVLLVLLMNYIVGFE